MNGDQDKFIQQGGQKSDQQQGNPPTRPGQEQQGGGQRNPSQQQQQDEQRNPGERQNPNVNDEDTSRPAK